MSDLFNRYKNRGPSNSYRTLLREVHKQWHNGRVFSSPEEIKEMGVYTIIVHYVNLSTEKISYAQLIHRLEN